MPWTQAMMRALLCSILSGRRLRAPHVLVAMLWVVACSGTDRPPLAKVAPIFRAFSVAGGSGAAWNQARRSADGETVEHLGEGPHEASLASDGFTSDQDFAKLPCGIVEP